MIIGGTSLYSLLVSLKINYDIQKFYRDIPGRKMNKSVGMIRTVSDRTGVFPTVVRVTVYTS